MSRKGSILGDEYEESTTKKLGYKLLILEEGKFADGGQLDDSGTVRVSILGGDHDTHGAIIHTEKHNCGASGLSIECSCGAEYQSAMHGCWQQGHQRAETGDKSLAEIMTLEYELRGAQDVFLTM